ncbi:MAG: hypothetical protein ABIP77_03905 [Candidatus Limnocylindrales bacterium]
MNPSDPRPIDATLVDALRSRTINSTTDIDQLLRTIVRAAESTSQRRSSWWMTLGIGRRTRWLPVVALLAVGSLGLLAVAAGTRLSDRALVRVPSNGPIVAVGGDEGWVVLDPKDGRPTSLTGRDDLMDPGRLAPVAGASTTVDLSWSPDGQRLAFATRAETTVEDLVSHTSTRIGGCGEWTCSVAWSPDGSWVAHADGRRLALTRPDGSGAVTVIDAGIGRTVDSPTWSPDGAWIAYVERATTSLSAPALWAIRPDGTGNRRLTLPIEAVTIGITDPAWSPDGSRIVYLGSDVWDEGRRNGAPLGTSGWELRIMAVDVTGLEAVPYGVTPVGRCFCMGFSPSFALSPDGSAYAVNTLAMPLGRAGETQDGLFVLDAATRENRYLRTASVGTISWQPGP